MYFYHAHAIALGGGIERPAPQSIAALASCALPISGGIISANEGKFDNGFVSFDSAQSNLTGSFETRNGRILSVTGASVIIRGLNIGNIVMADQVVLRMASEHIEHPPQPSPFKGQLDLPLDEPSIITTGSHFDNLKIAGYPVALEMAHDVFHDLPTYRDCQRDWAKGSQSRLRATLIGSALNRALGPEAPQHLQEVYQGSVLQIESPTLRPTVVCSFVKRVNGIDGTEINDWGPILGIPQFGTVYLGEVIVSPGRRRVNMIRVELGSPVAGTIIANDIDLNGTWYP